MAQKVFRAMAQNPKKLGPKQWLKLNFVLYILTSKWRISKNIELVLLYCVKKQIHNLENKLKKWRISTSEIENQFHKWR